MRNVDQTKHDVDIMERVLGELPAATDPPEPYTTLVDVHVHPELGSPSSATRLPVGILAEHAP